MYVVPALAATLCLALVTHGGAPAPQAKDVMQGELAYLKAEFAKPKLLKKAERKARMSAVILAAAAKAAGKDGEGMVGEALKIAKLMEAGKADEAKAIVADLASGKGTPTKTPGSYKDAIEFELVMRVFSSEKVGGFGMEKALEDLVDHKGAVSGEQAKAALNLATKIALVSDITLHFGPEKEEGAKTKKAWKAFSEDMTKAANELAASAAKNGEVSKLADNLGKTCTACHDVFR